MVQHKLEIILETHNLAQEQRLCETVRVILGPWCLGVGAVEINSKGDLKHNDEN